MDNTNQDQMRKEFAKLCNEGYENWRRDRISEGWPSSKTSAARFCVDHNIKPSNWSGWSKGERLPGELKNIHTLADVPYLGKRVYRVLGLGAKVDDLGLQEIIDDWPYMTEAEREIILKRFRQLKENKNYQTLIEQA